MKQAMYVAMWGVLDLAGGKYALSQLPEICDKCKALGYAGRPPL